MTVSRSRTKKLTNNRSRMSSAGRVLVVEDHEGERRAIMQILKSEGLTVYGAEDADKAMGYIELLGS